MAELKKKKPGQYVCRWENCRTVCATPKEMNDHLEQHVKQEPWECRWSGCSAMVEKKRWMYRSSLLQHMSSHVPDHRPVSCPFCEFRAAFQWRMAAHIRRKHANRAEGLRTTVAPNSPTSTTAATSSSSNSGSTPTTASLLFDGMALSSMIAPTLELTTLPGDDSTPIFIRPATPPPQPTQPTQAPQCRFVRPAPPPMLPRIEALDRKRSSAPTAGFARPRDAKLPVTVHVKSNVDALPALFQTTLSPSLTVAEFLSQVQSRYQERKPGQLAFHLSLARMPCGNVQHRVSIPLCKYEVPVMQLLGPEDHLMLCAVAPQE